MEEYLETTPTALANRLVHHYVVAIDRESVS
jgi:hypothetical protein